MNRLFRIHFSLLFIFCSAFSQEGWVWQNPQPQGNNLYAICSDPTYEGRYVAVGDYGTILVKDDRWIWYQMESGTKENLYSVCFSQTLGWAVGYNGTILHNTDGGVTWSAQNSGTTKMLLSVHFPDFLHGWAVGQAQTILYTTDMGTTWNDISTVGTHHYFSVYFLDYQNGWIAGAAGNNGIVMKTTDRGFTWTNSLIPDRIMNSIKFVHDTVGCVVGDDGRIYTTGNGGKNWSLGTSNTTSDLRDVCLKENGEGWAVGDDGTIIYTADYGNIWTPQSSPTTNTLYGVENGYAIGWGGVILGNGDGVWAFESSGFLDNIYGIDFGADAVRGFAVGEDGHIYYTSDAGETWTLQDSVTNLDLYAIDIISGKVGWIPVGIIVGQNGKAFFGSNNNWHDRSVPTTDHLFAAHRFWSGTAFVAGEFGRIFKTTDYGRDWDLMHENMGYHLYAIHFTSKNYGYAAGMSGAVIKTTNGGVDWTDVSPNNLNLFRSIYFIDRKLGWVVGINGAIFKTTDGGQSWTTPLYKYTSETLNSVKFIDENVGWIAGANGTILHTTNGGVDWYHQDSKSIGELRTISFPDIGVGWIGGFDGLVLHTDDGGGALMYKVYMKKYLELFVPDTGEVSDTIDIGTSPSVSDADLVSGVTVIIDSLVHPDVSSLVLILSHEGITDTLIAQGEISGSDIIQCSLMDASSISLEDGETPYADNFKPRSPLSAFYGTDPAGEWKLTVIDKVPGNTGILQSWGLKLYFETLTEVEDDPEVLPGDFYLHQNYPNPFNPSTTIQFEIPKRMPVMIKLYNIIGQEVMTIFDGIREVGKYEINIEGSKLSSGVYFYRLQAGGYNETKKLILMK